MKIPVAGYHGYKIVTLIHNYQSENTSNEEFNWFKQKAQSADEEKAVYDTCEGVHGGSDENHVRAEGFPERIQKKPCLSPIYMCKHMQSNDTQSNC